MPFPRGVGEDEFAPGGDAVCLCGISFVFPLCPSHSAGWGQAAYVALTCACLLCQDMVGSAFPHQPPGWQSLPHFLTGVGSCSSSHMHKSDCKSRCGKGGPTCPTLPFLPFHQDFSLANAVLLPAVICHQLQAPARRCSPWVAEDALGHHRVKLQPCSHLAKQGDTMPTLMRRGHHVHTVLTRSFFTGCGGNAVSVQCFQGHASG